jgi:hypothetical protein
VRLVVKLTIRLRLMPRFRVLPRRVSVKARRVMQARGESTRESGEGFVRFSVKYYGQ